MPNYVIYSLDVWGNAAEGFSINDRRRQGVVYLPSSNQFEDAMTADATEWDIAIVEALIEKGALAPGALAELRAGTLQLEHDHPGMQISETDRELGVMGPDGEMRWLQVPLPRRLDPDAFLYETRRRAVQDELLEEGESADDIEWVEDHRPILELEQENFDFDEESAFWSVEIQRTEMKQRPLKISLAFAEGRIYSQVKTVAGEGAYTDEDVFEWDIADWHARPSFGWDEHQPPRELRPTRDQLSEILVSLDAFMEKP